MVQIIAKNNTASPVAINTLTIPSQEIPASSQVVLTDWNTITEIYNNDELVGLIDAGTVVLLIDNYELSKQQSLATARNTVSYKEKDIYFCAYEAGTTTLGTGASTVGFDSTRVISDNNLFTLSGGEVTVSESGVYRVTYDVSFDTNSNSRSQVDHWLEINSTEVPGTRRMTYHRNNAENQGSASTSTLVELDANDVVRVRVDHTAGASSGGSTIANTSQISLEYIAAPE